MNTRMKRVGRILSEVVLSGILLVFSPLEAKSCDSCGGLGASTGFGFMPLADSRLVLGTYSSSGYGLTGGEVSDVTSTFSTSFRWLPSPRWRATVTVPVRWVQSTSLALTPQSLAGAGDLTGGLEWNVLPLWGRENRRFPGWLRLGGLVSAPTGKYMQRMDGGLIFPTSYQLGRGSWGAGGTWTLAVRSGRWVWAGFGSALGFAENELWQRPGTRLTLETQLTRTFIVRRWVLMPQLGLTHERATSALYFGSPLSDGTAARTSLTPGVTLSRERLVVQIRALAPLHEQAAGDLQLRRGFDLTLALNITKKAEESP